MTVPPASAATSAAARVIEDSWSEHGWSITSRKGPISGQAVLQGITSRLDSPPSLPEMVYGDNSLVLRHEASGLQLKFDAESALREWLREGQEPLQLMHADKWKEARTHEIQMTNAAVVSYDWTYTTPYRGSVRIGSNAGDDVADSAFVETAEQIDRAMLMSRDPIRFIDDVTLYESEMDDNGVCRCSVRVRHPRPSAIFVETT